MRLDEGLHAQRTRALHESDFVTPEEVYEGEWGLTANGEYSGVLMLDMTRTGGKRVQKLAARGMAADEAAKTVRQEALQCLTKRM